MKKHIQLNIARPCHESWDQMTPVDKGRFCGSCQKKVVDFTTMGDEQLALFFKKTSNGSVCGRFMQDQLDRTIEIPKKRIPWVKYFFQFALPAFLLSSKAFAQGQVKMLTGKPVIVSNPIIEEKEKITVTNLEKIIRGKVINDDGEGIPYVSVFIKETTIGVATDSAGNFTLRYSGIEDSIVLISSSVGFQDTENIIKLNSQLKFITIPLIYDDIFEGVTVGVVIDLNEINFPEAINVEKTTNILDTICNKIFPSKQVLKLFPNPLKRNTSLTIEMSRHEEGTHLFQLAALNGQIVLQKEFWLDQNDHMVKIDIPSVTAGAYFLTTINKQTGKNNTEKIIVE